MEPQVATAVARQEMENTQAERGLEGVRELLDRELNAWQTMSINIALIGLTGSGKSSLINALLGLNANDVGAAAIGCYECTTEAQRYRHPINNQLVYTDLPGVGSSMFPKNSYLGQIEADKYDFFLLVTMNRFTETDAWLAKELTKIEKKFFLVRTHIDNDVENDRRARANLHNEDELLAGIRARTETQLRELWTTFPTDMQVVFLIDSLVTDKYDFHDLEIQIAENLPELKREALFLLMRTTNRKIIDLKEKYLRERIWKAAAWSAGIAVTPIPGVSFAADVVILIRESKFYFQQLGLGSESLRRLAQGRGLDVSRLEQTVFGAFGVSVESLTPTMFATYLPAIGISLAPFSVESAVEAAASVFIPVIGSIVAASMSYLTTRWLLGKILDRMYAVAKDIYNEVFQG